ncbi:MAG: hypothetical protein HC810_00070 [Acaryochloridaceae cyanobacterium RL_2_7]|nr:hypothetical protein [Acaryochloridaceae cyanobacterium RL_2_7]
MTGFQGLVLLYMLVPDAIHEWSLDWLQSFAGTRGAGGARLAFLFLPYWWLTLSGVDFLRRRREPLVPLVERMALGYGGLLTLLTLGNSCLRCIFLICIGVTLWLRFGSKPSRLLVYLFHGVVLGAIASGIDFLFPTLAVDHWAMICLVFMVGEFALYAYGGRNGVIVPG